MRDHHLPDPIYNALPWAYVLTGVAVWAWLRNGIAAFSCLVLLATATHVWLLRLSYRRKATRERAMARTLLEQTKAEAKFKGLSSLTWHKRYESGHALIDAQHRRLFSIGNILIDAVLEDLPRADVMILLIDLVDDIKAHFQTEESVLAGAGLALSAEHRSSHQSMLEKAQDLQMRFARRQIVSGELVAFISREIIFGHVAQEDLLFGSALRCATETTGAVHKVGGVLASR